MNVSFQHPELQDTTIVDLEFNPVTQKVHVTWKTWVEDKDKNREFKDDKEAEMDAALFMEGKRSIFKNRTHFKAVANNGELQVVRYANLHSHSAFSILKSITRIEDMVEKAEYAIALTDYGNMFSSLEFYKQMTKKNKKPLIGFEAFIESHPYEIQLAEPVLLTAILMQHKINKENLLEANPNAIFTTVSDTNQSYNYQEITSIPDEIPDESIMLQKGQSLRIEHARQESSLVLLAKDSIGVKNLFKLTSNAYQNFNKKPYVTWEGLKNYREGIVCLSSGSQGEMQKAIMADDMNKARTLMNALITIYGEDFYLEIQRHGLALEQKVEDAIFDLAKEFDVKVIPTIESFYTEEKQAEFHDIHVCIGEKTTINDINREKLLGDGYHIQTSMEMVKRYSDVLDLLDNTLDLMDKLNPVIETGKLYMPKFPIPAPYKDDFEYMKYLVEEGFKKRFEGTPAFTSKEYAERIEFELETVKKMGFAGYFLIVQDYVNYAKDNGILVGPGRGSACGSLLTYCLRITDIDPIEYDLLFERFLNPDRISMPDIDIDFPDIRREDIINYAKRQYGIPSVTGVITFGSMKAKSVVRDIGRVLGYEPSVGVKIAKLIPKKIEVNGETIKLKLKNILKYVPEFKTAYQNDSDMKRIVDIAMNLEGLPRNISQHACAIIIAPSEVSNYLPTATVYNKDTHGRDIVTQFQGPECEEMGLLKMDFLGLRTMGVFDRTLQYINEQEPDETKYISFESIPLDDVNVYEFISNGHTAGVFQLESAGMTGLMAQMYQDIRKTRKVENAGRLFFERLIAGISLYRPGPIDEIPNYIHNMLHPKDITYELPQLEPILSSTFNIIVYQEQVMSIVRSLAGFSKGDADGVRKAMGKKKQELLEKYGEYFLYGNPKKNIKGCLENNIPKEIAQTLWERMKKFGEYAFNRSHSAGYSVIAIISAWFSYYFPLEFMTAQLNSFLSKADKIKQFMTVCKNRGIKILSPDVNYSLQSFSVDSEKKAIRFGFGGIRNMGNFGNAIIEEREARGQFSSLYNFIERMSTNHGVNKRQIEALIYSGALDSFEGTRLEKLKHLDVLVGIATMAKSDAKLNHHSLLSTNLFLPLQDYLVKSSNSVEMPEAKKLEYEREYTGFYVSGHPLDIYEHVFQQAHIQDLYKIKSLLSSNTDEEVFEEAEDFAIETADKNELEGKWIRITGVIQEMEIRTTRSQQQMANFVIEDNTATIKAIVFPTTFAQYLKVLRNGHVLSFFGKMEVSEFGTQFIITGVETMEELMTAEQPEEIIIRLNDNLKEAQVQFEQIMNIFGKEKDINNRIPVTIQIDGKSYRKRGGKAIMGNKQLQTVIDIQNIVGLKNMNVVYPEGNNNNSLF